MRELSLSETNAVSGGWVWHVVGGAAGAAIEYGDRADDGDMTWGDWAAVAGGAVAGAMGVGLGRAIIGKAAGKAASKAVGKGGGGGGGGGGGLKSGSYKSKKKKK